MSNKKSMSKLTIFLLVDAIVIVALVFLLKSYINEKVGETVVYQFTQNLPADYKIQADNVVEVTMPKSAINSHTIVNKEDVVGKFTSDKVYQGQVADDRYVAEQGREDALASLPDKDKKNLRKIAIEADMFSTWGGSIARGDRVDLGFIGKAETKLIAGESVENVDDVEYAKVFLQNVLVYDVLSSSGASYLKPEDRPMVIVDPNNTEATDSLQQEIKSRSDVEMVVLAVTIDQYEEIVARQQVGKVVLVGRFKESESVITEGFAMGKVIKPVEIGPAKTETKKAEVVTDSKKSDW